MSKGWRKLRVFLQVSVSLTLLALVTTWVGGSGVLETLRGLSLHAVVAAVGIYALSTVLNSFRWQLLLRNLRIDEDLGPLTGLFLIGQFFSLFLPTGIGGDVVRVYQVARRSRKTAETIMATLQDRVLLFSATLLTGLASALSFYPQLPSNLRLPLIGSLVLGSVGLPILLYPQLLAALGRLFGLRVHDRAAGNRLLAGIRNMLRAVVELPPLGLPQLMIQLPLATIQVMLGVAIGYVLAQSLNLAISYGELCLVIPVVYLVRMVPISLNGYGVAEGSMVFFLSLFGVPSDQGFGLALVLLAVSTSMPLVGGLVLAVQSVRGTWVGSPDEAPQNFATANVEAISP